MWRSPIGVFIAPALGLMLWHGGFRPAAQVAMAAIAVLGLTLYGADLRPTFLNAGLAAAAAGAVASLAWHSDRSSIAPVLAAIAVPCLVGVAAKARARLMPELPLVVALLGATVATTGLAGLALRIEPLAERIAGVWRAQGTLEYPPALGLVCVCALAAALALHAEGTLDRPSAVAVGILLAVTAIATFDRMAWIETAAVLVLFGARLPAARRTVLLIGSVSALGALAALAVSHPSTAALERHLRHGPISSRSDVWHTAWDGFSERPWLGYGPGEFRAVYDPATSVASARATGQVGLAHNAVLEQAVESGVVAAVGTAVALAAMLVVGLRGLASTDPLRLSAGVAAFAVALSGLYDITWSFAPLLLMGAVSAAAVQGRQT
jgi:O-antigen ligase